VEELRGVVSELEARGASAPLDPAVLKALVQEIYGAFQEVYEAEELREQALAPEEVSGRGAGARLSWCLRGREARLS
jgi:hypothetical protein